MVEEESFPRGGKRIIQGQKRPKTTDDNLFKTSLAPVAKKSKKSKKKERLIVTEDIFQSSLNIHGTLSYSKIQDGMTILGCVRNITNFSLEVELPGLTFATVSITNISDPFTKYMNERLEENDHETDSILRCRFQIGQMLPVKILNTEVREENTFVGGSINPRDINDGKNHDSFKKDTLVWGCIQSVADHGYEMSLGVKNCRVFLPSKNVDEEKSYAVGETLWCTIHKSETASTVTTLRISAKANHIKSTKLEEIHNLGDLIPGMQVDVVTEKITKHGIHCKFLENFFGYIDENYLKTSLKKLEDYREGQLLTAFILYIEPHTKITHLTLRGIENVPHPTLKFGDIISAEVLSKARNGVYFQLPNKEKGFVTNRRIINSLPKSPNADISQMVSSRYTPSSQHTCKILDYNRISKMYICTVEPKIIKQKILNKNMLEIGQKVEVMIEKINDHGLVVSLEGIRGFVPNIHISNVLYSDNLKKKYKEGQKVNARVLVNEEDNILFTIKPRLVDSDGSVILSTYDQAKTGEAYVGVVVSTTPRGALIAFYGNTKGFLSKKKISNGEEVDPSKYFFRGQVVTVKILYVDGEKMQLTLKDAKPLDIKIGQTIVGVVKQVNEDEISIRSKDRKYKGVIPVCHLSNYSSLNQALKNTFKKGDKIRNLICISNKFPVTFSRKLALELKENTLKLPKFESLRIGHLIRCFYENGNTSGIFVTPLLRNYNWDDKVFINKKNVVSSNKEDIPSLEHHKILLAKVVIINHKDRKLGLSVRLDQVFDKNVETSVNFFSHYVSELNYLRQVGLENDWDICEYSPGQKVNCKIETIPEKGGGCVVSLPNGCKGLVVPHLCPSGVKEGETLKGVFLTQDFQNNYGDICLKSDICNKINKNQDGVIPKSSLSSVIVEKLLVKSNFILTVTKQTCNRQLVYIPLKLHQNDFTGCLNFYDEKKFKVCVCGKVKNCLIGVSKKLFIKIEKERSRDVVEENITKDNLEFPLGKTDTNNKSLDSNRNIKVKKLGIKENLSGVNALLNSDDKKAEAVENNTKANKKSKSLQPSIQQMQKTSSLDKEIFEENDENSSSCLETVELENEKIGESNTSKGKRKKLNDHSEVNISREDKNPSLKSSGPLLPGVSSFFSTSAKTQVQEESSDDDDQEPTVKKKRKLTPSEKAELLRQEEERISKIEKDLADPNKNPESAEQFERLLLANPNSSELWTKYISFHIAATEVDKARTVAKKALETIDMTLIEEKFNIWVVLLNLENMFGTKESFEKVLEEALRYNDPLQIYLRTIQMLAEAGKFTEMEEKVKKCRGRFKQDRKMWLEIAKIYYQINKFEEARNLKDGGLKSITDRKSQMTIIVRFALMEFKYGEVDQGCSIFEAILSNDPKKVNIWTTYVDQLVKKGKIDQARLVLDRSVSQKLPLKSMKVLFMKFRKFEEDHGSSETVEEVKQRAQDYLSKVVK